MKITIYHVTIDLTWLNSIRFLGTLVIGKLLILIFLKYLRLAYLPITKGGNLCDLSAFAYKAIERYSLLFLHPESHLIANVLSGSNL